MECQNSFMKTILQLNSLEKQNYALKMIRFQDLASEEKKLQVQDMDVPAKELAQMAIRYAREMEQIV